jgi:hypothetical protein
MKINKQSGQVSKIVIILALAAIVLVIIIYGFVKFIGKRGPGSSDSNGEIINSIDGASKKVHETTIGDIRFLLESSQDQGSVLKGQFSYENDLNTTERFIKVIVGAQNKGKNNIASQSWEVGNIVDSEGRNFTSINDKVFSLLPKPDLCGTILKPEFKPVPCVKYYEVSKISKGLKIVVRVNQPKKQDALIDLR